MSFIWIGFLMHIPLVDPWDLPGAVRLELTLWAQNKGTDDISYFRDYGIVFVLSSEDVCELPLFTTWLVNNGMFSEEEMRDWKINPSLEDHNSYLLSKYERLHLYIALL